jgi:hypothetical protein
MNGFWNKNSPEGMSSTGLSPAGYSGFGHIDYVAMSCCGKLARIRFQKDIY